ncbi:MAG: PAS/PAC sensor hybrid histidine kinase [uncultured bacterium]|nr:MAG: PAS/PAC sensor hybrid histidine kinase [uncultured bacterium]
MKQYLSNMLADLLTAKKKKIGDPDAESRFLQYTVISSAGLLAMFLYYVTYLGGEDNSKILWVNISPLITFFLLGRKEGLIWISVMWLSLAAYFFRPYELPGGHVYSHVFAIRFLVAFTVISVITYFYENFRQKYRAGLEEKNSMLLAEIEERQKIESSLRESEARYRAIYLHAAEGILLINFQGDIVECNPQILAMLGYRQPDVVGRNILTLFHPEDLERLPPQIDKLRSGEVLFIERRLRTASGIYLLCEQSGKKINEDLIILLYRDITESNSTTCMGIRPAMIVSGVLPRPLLPWSTGRLTWWPGMAVKSLWYCCPTPITRGAGKLPKECGLKSNRWLFLMEDRRQAPW